MPRARAGDGGAASASRLCPRDSGAHHARCATCTGLRLAPVSRAATSALRPCSARLSHDRRRYPQNVADDETTARNAAVGPPSRPELDDWRALAEREVKGDPDQLVWDTPEGIRVKPLYTEADLEGLEAVGTLP